MKEADRLGNQSADCGLFFYSPQSFRAGSMPRCDSVTVKSSIHPLVTVHVLHDRQRTIHVQHPMVLRNAEPLPTSMTRFSFLYEQINGSIIRGSTCKILYRNKNNTRKYRGYDPYFVENLSHMNNFDNHSHVIYCFSCNVLL